MDTVPGILVIVFHHREYGGGYRQQGRCVRSKLEKTTSFIVDESLYVSPEHTHLHPLRCLDTPKESSGKNFLVFL